MIPFIPLQPITLAQKSIWKRQYELLDGEHVIGTLSFPSIFRDELKIESGERCWIMEKKGILNITITVRVPESKRPIATIPLKQKRGVYTIKLPRYRSVRLQTNLLKSEYILKTTMNATLCTLTIRKLPQFSGELRIEKKEEFLPEYPWLVYLVAYIALLGQRNSV